VPSSEKAFRRRAAEGRIHSVETCGTVDGPGVRFVVFVQGCALRCLYCHNADTRDPDGGRRMTPADLLREALKYKSYMKFSGGGVTVTGGEPLLQAEFVASFFELCRQEGLHTTLDTSGFCPLERARPALDASDLVLLDIKSMDPETHRRVTGASREPTLAVARYLSGTGKPMWIRFVLVPGLTDSPSNIAPMADFIAGLRNVQKIQVLPFHKMGEYKWAQMGMSYDLKDTPIPTPGQVEAASSFFRAKGLKVE